MKTSSQHSKGNNKKVSSKSIPISKFNPDNSYEIVLPTARKSNRIIQVKAFADTLEKIQDNLMNGMKISARGWGYRLENESIITKKKINNIFNLINNCRKEGFLDYDFTKEDVKRKFDCIGSPTLMSVTELINYHLDVDYIPSSYNLDFWEDKDCYIQILVEKTDLIGVFEPICEKYNIPIGNAGGWNDINSRGQLLQRFKINEENGKKPILLYVGDFDPAGFLISQNLKKNLQDLKNSTLKYDCKNLTIDRIGLNLDFINKHNLAWIENLETANGVLAVMEKGKIKQGWIKKGNTKIPHPDFNKTYVQSYLKKYGVRKVEANALIKDQETMQDARDLLMKVLKKYLGNDYEEEFEQAKQDKKEEIRTIMEENNIFQGIEDLKIEEEI